MKSELGEDEVLAVIEPAPDHKIDAKELFEFLTPRLAHFMLPRYIRVMERMPYTQTHKVQKAKLRSDAINVPGIWDRQIAGFTIKRDNLS